MLEGIKRSHFSQIFDTNKNMQYVICKSKYEWRVLYHVVDSINFIINILFFIIWYIINPFLICTTLEIAVKMKKRKYLVRYWIVWDYFQLDVTCLLLVSSTDLVWMTVWKKEDIASCHSPLILTYNVTNSLVIFQIKDTNSDPVYIKLVFKVWVSVKLIIFVYLYETSKKIMLKSIYSINLN
jgi:hypothetical protein